MGKRQFVEKKQHYTFNLKIFDTIQKTKVNWCYSITSEKEKEKEKQNANIYLGSGI